jgi:PAS domain S-box-containing protein
MNSDKSELIAELAELYEFSLNIGTSLNTSKNAIAFFTSFAQRKNLKYISVWHRQEDVLHLKESFPKLQGAEQKIGRDSPLCKHFTVLEEGKVHRVDEQNMCFSGFDAPSVWLYYSKGVYILFLQNEFDLDFSSREKSQFATLLKKFSLSMKACFSHQASLEEVLKRSVSANNLFERESLYRFGANSLSEGIVVTDLENKITYVNNAMSEITGFTRDEMSGAVAYKLFRPLGFDKETRNIVYEKIIQDKSKMYEIQQIRKDETRYWVRITVSAFKNSKGIIIGSISSMLNITETFNYQRAIEKSQKDLQELLDTMYDGLLLLDSNGVIKEANNSALDLFEIDIDNLGQISIGDLVHPDEKATVSKIRKKVIKEGALLNFVFKMQTPSGKTKYVEVSSSPIWKDGAHIGSRDIVRDITEKVNAQREINLKNAELEDLIENMYDALIVTGSKGEIRNVNKAGEKLLGYPKEEALKLDLKAIVHPDDAARSRKYLKKLETDGYYSGYQGRILAGDGSIKEIEVNSTAILEDGQLVGSRDIIRDISERKELERQRKLSETKLRLIIDTALDAVVTMDAEGKISEWNKNAEHIFGYTHDEVIGKRMSELIIPQRYKEVHKNGMKHYFDSGEGPVLNSRIEITAINKDNREFPIELSITQVSQDGTTFFSAFIRDITDRKEIEAQKESLLGELESVNQELRDFAYIVSHDLKAPLRSIGSLSDWLIQDYEEVIDAEGKELLQLLKARIGRMHGLIEGVLQYSKVGRLKDEKEQVDINIVVAETIDLLDPPSNVEVKVNPNLPTVSYDRVRLQQVFQNLLSNAIKFLDKPKGLLEVVFKEDDSFYYFSVKDNGPGIEDAYFQKIFQIFQTLRAKDNYESTGIGLSIVKRIVELNGGSISVSSEVGVGSTFSFTIPKN